MFSDTLKWHTRNLVLGVTRNWGKTVVNWNLALDPNGGPHNGGCDTCTGVLTVGPGDTFTQNAEYFTLGHLARFVAPGAVRIASTSFGTTGWNGQIMDVAFRNRDGSTALVVHNENDDPRTLRRRAGRLVVRLHAAGRRARDVRVEGAARRRLPAARSAAAVRRRRSTTTPPRPGAAATLNLDLGRTQRVRRVVVDAGTAAPPGPATLTIGGKTWTADGSAASSPPSTFRRRRRGTCGSPSTTPATVADVRIYR